MPSAPAGNYSGAERPPPKSTPDDDVEYVEPRRTRFTGTVVRWERRKRFGQIESDDGRLVLVTLTELGRSGIINLAVGDRVDFTILKGARGGVRAASVSFGGLGSSPPF